MKIRNISQYFDHNPIYRNAIPLCCEKTINFTLFGRLKVIDSTYQDMAIA